MSYTNCLIASLNSSHACYGFTDTDMHLCTHCKPRCAHQNQATSGLTIYIRSTCHDVELKDSKASSQNPAKKSKKGTQIKVYKFCSSSSCQAGHVTTQSDHRGYWPRPSDCSDQGITLVIYTTLTNNSKPGGGEWTLPLMTKREEKKALVVCSWFHSPTLGPLPEYLSVQLHLGQCIQLPGRMTPSRGRAITWTPAEVSDLSHLF